jgi:predicted permease
MSGLKSDLRWAWRGLSRRPGFTAVAILSLALGIGANATVFSLANAVLLRPLPVRDPGRLVALHTVTPDVPFHLQISWQNFRDLRERVRTLSSLIATGPATVSLSGGGRPEQVFGQMVTGDYFGVLGVKPALGRGFLPEEDRTPGSHPVVVLGDGLWRRRFGGDRGIVGRTIRMNGEAFTVVGVAPPGFRGLQPLNSPELWVPMMMYPRVMPGRLRPYFEVRGAPLLGVVGRLAPGRTLEQARQELESVSAALAAEHPQVNERRTVVPLPLLDTVGGPDEHAGYVRAAGLLLALVGAVLLIACANLANLLLARSAGRRPEMAVRLSLGSSRGRLVRQLLTESLLLVLAGGLAGLLLAAWARRLVPLLGSPYLPDALEIPIDGRVLAFTLGISVLTGLLFGLAPALQAGRADLAAGLGNRAREAAPGRLGRFGFQGLLVALQIALSLVALAGAAAFLRSLANARSIDPGFDHERLLVLSFDLDGAGYDEARGRDLLRRMTERLEAVPGVRSAAVGENLLLVEPGLRRAVAPDGGTLTADSGPPIIVQTNAVSPAYFDTMGIRRLRGRGFTGADRDGAPAVVVINRTMAERLWAGEDPVGRRFRFLGPDEPEREVVGVVEDSRYNELGEEPQLYVFLPLAQAWSSAVSLHVRTEGDPEDLLAAVRREVQAVVPQVPLVDVRPMSRVLDLELWAPRTGAALFSLLGGVALLLSLVGVYGVTAYGVAQRWREIGIRSALGARHGDVQRLFLRRGMAAVIAGLALGLAGALALSRWISSMLYDVAATDPVLLGSAALLLTGAALLATWIPSRQAARVPPAVVLRQD